MASIKMHPDEIQADLSLVRQLIAAQFPQWANLPLQSLESAGTSNIIYRLGTEMMVRLPRTLGSVSQLGKEQRWLRQLAPYLPLAIPIPLGHGTPSETYPYPWSVYRWIEGDDATYEPIFNLHEAAIALGRFVAALQKIDPTQGPPAGEHNFFRGVPLESLDAVVRKTLESLEGLIDVLAATAAWETALKVPPWKGPLRWIHGDLHAGNLLVRNSKLVAVIDFGGLGVGDPACDMMAAWTYFSSETRKTFQTEVGVDDSTWARGRGWALYLGVVALPYYQQSNPVLASIARQTIAEVLADQE